MANPEAIRETETRTSIPATARGNNPIRPNLPPFPKNNSACPVTAPLRRAGRVLPKTRPSP